MSASSPVVVITGGTAGIGRATAIEFAKRGARVAVLARGKKRLHQTELDIAAHGGRGLGIECDVAYFHQVENAAWKVEQEFGPIDIWVNNASVTVFSPVNRITPHEYKRVTEVTYLGVVNGTLAALNTMLPRNIGTIVQVGSALSYRAIPLQAAYCAAKHAVRAFTNALRVELLHDQKQVHLTMVHLPGINTPQFSWSRSHLSYQPRPIAPVYQPELAAQAIVFATRVRRREIWVGQPTAATILINKLFPSLFDHYLATTAYSRQQTSKKVSSSRQGNLFHPLPGNYSSHGVFDAGARDRSWQFVFEKLPGVHYFTDIIASLLALMDSLPDYFAKIFSRVISI